MTGQIVRRKPRQQVERPTRVVRRSSVGKGGRGDGVSSTTTKRIVRRSNEKKRVVRPSGWHPEQALISSILKTGTYVSAIDKGLNETWFHAYPDEWTFVQRYIEKYRKTPTLRSFTRRYPDFELAEEEDIDHLVEEVRQTHARHTLLVTIDSAMETVKSGGDVLAAVRETESKLITLHSQVDGYANQSSIREDWQEVWREVAARAERKAETGTSGIATGFETIDLATGGIGAGEFWIFGARLGNGKTWTISKITATAALAGHSVLYYTLEASRNQLQMRLHNLLCTEFGKDIFSSLDLMRGTNFDLIKYKQFLRTLSRDLAGTVIVDDTSRGRVTGSTIAAGIEKHQPDLVVIDYVQLMNPGGDYQKLAAISADLQGISSRYNTAMAVASQINRVGAGKAPPGPETLAESDNLGRDIDCLITQSKQSDHLYQAMIAKYRHGPDGQKFYIHADMEHGRYVEINGNDAMDIKDADQQAEEEREAR